MAPLRVLFLLMVIVAVVTVTNGSANPRAASKFSDIKDKVKNSKVGSKLKGLGGSSGSEKAKGWGRSAHTKIKSVAEGHPAIKDAGEKVIAKLSEWKDSASESSSGTKARGLANNAGTKVKAVIGNAKSKVKDIKKLLRNAKAVNKANSKLSGLKRTFTKTRGVGKTDALKSAVRSTSSKLKDFKGTAKTSLKDSQLLKSVKDKLPASSLDTLKKLPGGQKLASLTSGQSTDTSSALKDKFASLKSAASSFKNKFS